MCGIAGAIDLSGFRPFPAERLLAMTEVMGHRGPDDEQTHHEPGIAMGARRLSIVDLEGGRQPIANETGDIWVAFNGELFDYPEIRQELLSRGHQLKTRCDTEAWVHLYEDFREGFFEKAKGQFAVSLWDRPNRTLILGRDRVGICPLYYVEADGWLLWASEIKSLLASGLVTPRPDVKGIDYLFNFFCAGTTQTCFEGIKSISPGCYLKVKNGKIGVRQYWDLDFPDKGDERRVDNPNLLVEEFESLLRKAVKRRLRADVPVVSYLSGGIDSTVILRLCSDERKWTIPSFTVGLDNAGPDERSNATESAVFCGSQQTTLTMNPEDIVGAYPELILAAESPVIDTTAVCLMKLAAAVHQQGYKVALTGEGADEALGGYFWFKVQTVLEGFSRFFGLAPRHFLRRALLASIGGGSAHAPPFYLRPGVRALQQMVYEWLGQCREIFYSQEMWSLLAGHSSYSDLNLSNDRIVRWHHLNQALYVGYKVMLPGLLMQARGDRVAMHSSVETRYPFLDEDVIDFCARLDPSYKLHGMTNKWLLRQVAQRILPPHLYRRKKRMFRAERSKVFLGPHRPFWVDQILSRESLKATRYFNPDIVEQMCAAQNWFPVFTPRRLVLDMGVSGVIATQLWHHIFCGGGLSDLPTWQSSLNSPSSLV